MPGSRKKEVQHHLPIQLETVRRLARADERIRVALLLAPTLEREDVEKHLEDLRFPIMIWKEEPTKMISLTDLVLATSGTATLMVGLMQKPMVVMYRLSWISEIVGRLLVRIKYFCIVNIVFDEMVVPERLQRQAVPDVLESDLKNFLQDPDYYLRTKQKLSTLPTRLGDKGATVRVAKALKRYFHEG